MFSFRYHGDIGTEQICPLKKEDTTTINKKYCTLSFFFNYKLLKHMSNFISSVPLTVSVVFEEPQLNPHICQRSEIDIDVLIEGKFQVFLIDTLFLFNPEKLKRRETDFLRIFTTGKSDILLVWKLKHFYKIIIRVNSVHLQWSFHNRLNFSHIFQPNKLERRLKGETQGILY